jgi:hypothetical protein
MIIIEIKNNENIDKALKILKSKVIKLSGIISTELSIQNSKKIPEDAFLVICFIILFFKILGIFKGDYVFQVV